MTKIMETFGICYASDPDRVHSFRLCASKKKKKTISAIKTKLSKDRFQRSPVVKKSVLFEINAY